jgi:peptide-methionine (R)-S-oxide reductase
VQERIITCECSGESYQNESKMMNKRLYLRWISGAAFGLLVILASCRNGGRAGQLAGNARQDSTEQSVLQKEGSMDWNDVLRYAAKGSPAPDRRVEKTNDEWRKILTREQYDVTRLKGTERAFSGEYCEAHKPGLYACVCCQTVLFDSRVKFESGTGWPSFTIPVKDNVIKYHADDSYGMERIEALCNVCDAHLGHVFPDGPKPSGLRYCINSASLSIHP